MFKVLWTREGEPYIAERDPGVAHMRNAHRHQQLNGARPWLAIVRKGMYETACIGGFATDSDAFAAAKKAMLDDGWRATRAEAKSDLESALPEDDVMFKVLRSPQGEAYIFTSAPDAAQMWDADKDRQTDVALPWLAIVRHNRHDMGSIGGFATRSEALAAAKQAMLDDRWRATLEEADRDLTAARKTEDEWRRR